AGGGGAPRRRAVRRAAAARPRRRRRAGGAGLPPRPHGPRPPPRVRRRDRRARRGGGARAGHRRAGRGGWPPGGRLLARHAAAARPGRRAARRPARAGARRAGQRARPRGHRLAAHVPAGVRRAGPQRADLQPPARGGRADRRPHRRDQPRALRLPGLARRAAGLPRRPRARALRRPGAARRRARRHRRARDRHPARRLAGHRGHRPRPRRGRGARRGRGDLRDGARAGGARAAVLPAHLGAVAAVGVSAVAAPVRAEVRKVASTKLWWGLLVPVTLLSSMINLFGGVFTAAFPESERLPLLLGSLAYALGFTGVFAAVHGVVAAAGEFRHRTITTTYLTTRGRAPVLLAKML